MRIIDVFRKKIVMLFLQTLLLNLIVYYFGYQFALSFDIDTTIEQQVIVQFLANYTLFDILPNLFFIYIIWILVSLIPIVIYSNFKKAYSMNLLTYFFPNFFLYVFLSRYASGYFSSYFWFHFLHTILLGILLVFLSIILSFLMKKAFRSKIELRIDKLDDIVNTGKVVCPKCGIEFDSIPKFCYNCNTALTIKIEETTNNKESQ